MNLPHQAQQTINNLEKRGITLALQMNSELTPLGTRNVPRIYPQGGAIMPNEWPIIHRYRPAIVAHIEAKGNFLDTSDEVISQDFDFNRTMCPSPQDVERCVNKWTDEQDEYLLSIHRVQGKWPGMSNSKSPALARLKQEIMLNVNALGPRRIGWDSVRLRGDYVAKRVAAARKK